MVPCARRQDTASILNLIFMFMHASFRNIDHGPLTIDHRPKNKKPFIHNRDEEFSPRYHPTSVERFEGCKSQVENLPIFKRSFLL